MPSRPVQPVQPVSPVDPVEPIQESEEAAHIDIDQEREAILRMIAEGRVTPEEGDMLLEALGE
jgi:hypothetical protein